MQTAAFYVEQRALHLQARYAEPFIVADRIDEHSGIMHANFLHFFRVARNHSSSIQFNLQLLLFWLTLLSLRLCFLFAAIASICITLVIKTAVIATRSILLILNDLLILVLYFIWFINRQFGLKLNELLYNDHGLR